MKRMYYLSMSMDLLGNIYDAGLSLGGAIIYRIIYAVT